MPLIRLNIKSSFFNTAFLPLLDLNAKMQFIYGGAGSGKSVFISQRVVLDLLQGKRNYLVVRKNYNWARRSAFVEIQKAMRSFKMHDYFTINRSDATITCDLNKRQAVFAGLDDVDKLKSVTPEYGVFTDIWAEEASELSRPDFRQLELRLRGWSDVIKRMTFSFNPISRLHWIYTDFFNGKKHPNLIPREIVRLKTTYLDNRFLTEDDRQRMEALKLNDPEYYKVYGLGEWGETGNVILRNWHTANLATIREMLQPIRQGLDFGFANDPAAFVRASRRNKQIYIMEAFYIRGATNDVTAEKLRCYSTRNNVISCDPAEPKSVQELCNMGINAVGARATKWNYRIQWLRQHEIIVDESCQDLINELGTWKWKLNKNGDPTGEPEDRNDHCIAALCFAFEEEMNYAATVGMRIDV